MLRTLGFRFAPRLGLLREPDFARLWAATTVSVFGTQVTNLAIPLVAATVLQASAFEFGLLGTLEMLPFILLTLPAGVWVDRMRRRPILVASDLGRALVLATIPLAALLGVLSLAQLYLVGFVAGVLAVLFDVAYQSYLPSVVERDRLVEGNGRLEVSRSAAQVVGPGFSGLLIGALTAPIAIAVDALSFLVSAGFLAAIRRPEALPESLPEAAAREAAGEALPEAAAGEAESDGASSSLRAGIASGLRYVLGHPWLRAIALTTGISNLFSSAWGAILVLFLVRERGLGAAEIGLVFSLSSAGVLVGALAASRIAGRLGVGPTLVFGALCFSVGGLPIVVAPPALVVPAAILGIVIEGFGGVVWNVNQVSLRQAITPAAMQGRMNASMRFIVWGTIPVGTLAGGALGDAIGLFPTVALAALLGVVSFVPVVLSPVRRLRAMPTGPEPAGPAPTGA